MTRKLVLLLGMHRSGTSLLAQTFARAGLPMGQRLLVEGRPDNSEGYWEDQDIVAAQDAFLLARFGSPAAAWGAPGLDSVLGSPGAGETEAELRGALADILKNRFAASPVFGFKDPRTARLLPIWLDLADEFGAEVVPVLATRAPAEVAESLVTRNGVAHALGELMWLRHTHDALEYVGDRLIGVVDYRSWFESPGECLDVVRRVFAEAKVDCRLESPLARATERHHREGASALPIARDVYDALAMGRGAQPDAALRRDLNARTRYFVGGLGGWSKLGAVLADSRILNSGPRLPLAYPGDRLGENSIGAAVVLNGNRFSVTRPGAYLLHANRPGTAPATLLWRGVQTSESARLSGCLALPDPRAPPMLVAMTVRDESDLLLSSRRIPIRPGELADVDAELPPGRVLDVRIEVQVDGADTPIHHARIAVRGFRIEHIGAVR